MKKIQLSQLVKSDGKYDLAIFSSESKELLEEAKRKVEEEIEK